MRRNFFTAFAGVISFLMIGAMTADAAEITFGGRIRPRFEYWNFSANQGGAQVDQDAHFIDTLVRLQAKAKIDDKTSAFIQLQSNARFGTDPSVVAGVGAGPGAPNQPNDTSVDVGIHQAYFTLNKFFGAPVDLQFGRQEIILDGHRLFGNTIWTQGMQSHDAIRLTHSHANHTIMYAYSQGVENSGRGGAGGTFVGGSTDDVDDLETHVLWANFKGLIGENSSTSGYLVLTDQDCNTPGATAGTGISCAPGLGSGDFWTIGIRQAGGFGDISYRGEFYYQTGKSNIAAPGGGAGDLDAFMFGLRAGYKAKSVPMKPGITLWFDYLSGSSAADIAAGDQSDFRTLYDTGHKYYGLMDFFLGGPTGNGPTHPAAGLIDYAVKLSAQPMANTTLKVDIHHFEVAEDDLATGGVSGPSSLGQEIDVTLVHKYSPSTKMSVGYSHFFARELLSFYTGAVPRIQNNEDSDWLYVMFDVMF